MYRNQVAFHASVRVSDIITLSKRMLTYAQQRYVFVDTQKYTLYYLVNFQSGSGEAMNRIEYLLQCIKNMNYKNYFKAAEKVHNRTGRPILAVLFDITYCGFRYSAGYEDYLQSSMWELNKFQRSQIVTRGVNNEIIVKYNDPKYFHCFDDKNEFNTLFSRYLHRDWVYIKDVNDRDKFARFIEGRDKWMLKPLHGEGGFGVKKLPATMEAFDKNTDSLPYLAEEVIIQHPVMADLNPSSVNTLRMLTFLKDDGTSELAYVYLRIGYGDVVVDNFCSGGVVANVDLSDGTVHTPAVDTEYRPMSKHPFTGAQIEGLKIPFFDEAREMVLDAAKVVPQIRWVGWDIAITENGPVMVEGNEYPGYLFNFKVQHPEGYGMKGRFEKIFGEPLES